METDISGSLSGLNFFFLVYSRQCKPRSFWPVEDIIILIALLDAVSSFCLYIGLSGSQVHELWYSFICVKNYNMTVAVTENVRVDWVIFEMHIIVFCFTSVVWGLYCTHIFKITKVKSHDGSRGGATRNNDVSKEVLQHFHCWVCGMSCYSILLKSAVLFLNFQKRN